MITSNMKSTKIPPMLEPYPPIADMWEHLLETMIRYCMYLKGKRIDELPLASADFRLFDIS